MLVRPVVRLRTQLSITETGRMPDNSEGLSRAYYWGASRKPGDSPEWCP
jgi:hypothetical protein